MLRNHLKLHLKWYPEFQKFGTIGNKNNSSGDDFQSEKVFSVDVNLLKEKAHCENISSENK